MSEAIDCINLGELEARARKLLPQMAYDYYAGAAITRDLVRLL
jgi:hypothetical protein